MLLPIFRQQREKHCNSQRAHHCNVQQSQLTSLQASNKIKKKPTDSALLQSSSQTTKPINEWKKNCRTNWSAYLIWGQTKKNTFSNLRTNQIFCEIKLNKRVVVKPWRWNQILPENELRGSNSSKPSSCFWSATEGGGEAVKVKQGQAMEEDCWLKNKRAKRRRSKGRRVEDRMKIEKWTKE